MTAEFSEIIESLRAELRRSASPWLDRAAAAAYACHSQGQIDEAANRGLLQRHYPPGSTRPLFRREELDEWIRSGTEPTVKRGRKPNLPCASPTSSS